MQVCPFCNVDRGDRPLNEGRCPNCGIVLDWQDVEGEASVPVDSKSVPAEAPTANQKESNEADDASPNVEPSSSSENLPVQEATSESLPKTVRKSLQKGSWPTQDIVELWRHSISDVSKPQQTLKGVASAGTVSDSIFSIQQREIRSGDVDVGVPVDYQLLEVIGQGGVGVVYAARQSSIDRMVAVKMLREEYRSRSDHRDKFLAEAVVTGELDHPNIVPIYDLGRSVNGELFYSMKNVVGTPWDKVITQKSLRENLDILLKVADAVAFAHSRGVVHRDLKPENVMLGEYGEVLVMDWGIALPTAGFRKDSGILRSQAMGGTPAYMAPEMATGPLEKIGPPADVYLLGAILFEILTGMPPHFGNDVMDCVLNASQNIIQETEVTGELMDIAKLSMSTAVRRRYRSVQDFQNAIRLYQSHSESITLSDNAERDLASATETKDYQELSRIVFAFREALSLWKENTAAEDGLIRAQLAYATTALDKGDFDLGLSILDRDRQEHRMLVRKLEEAQKDREVKQARFQAIRKLAIALAGFIFVAGSIAMVVILALFQQVSSSYSTLQAQSNELEIAKDLADSEKNKAIEEGENARIQKEKAEEQKKLAENRRKDAEVARLESVAQRMRAEESSYSAELGLVSASLDQNGFSIAANVLERQLQSASKSKLRHWEWGHNWFLVHSTTGDEPDPPVQSIKRDSILVAIDSDPSGSLVALGLADGTIEIWGDSRTEPLYKVQHGTKLTQLDMDASGRYLVSCGMDGEKHLIHVWRLGPKGEPVVEKSLQHGSLIETVSFSNGNDPSLIVWSDRQRFGRISRWRDGSEVAVLLGHLESITSVVFSPDNKWVASSSLDGSVRIWNSQTGEQVQKFSEHQGSVMSVAFAPDGKKIASAGADRKILLWDLDTTGNLQKEFENTERQVKGEKLAPPKFETFMGHSATVRSVRFSADGQMLVSTANDNVVNVWDMAPSATTNPVIKELRKQGRSSREKGVPLVRLRGHGGWVTSCCVLQEGGILLTASDDTTWKRWRVLGYREQYRLGDGQVPILDGHFSPDGKAIATAHLDGTINLWDANTGKSISVLKEGHEYLTNKARFAKEGRILVTAAGDNSIRLWDVEKGSQFAVLERSGRNAVFSISADSQWLASGGDESGFVVWNLNDLDEEPKRLRPWNQAAQDSRGDFDEPTSMAISRNGDYVFVGNKNGNCEFWSNKLGKMLFQEMGHSDAIVASFFLDSNTANGLGSAVVLTASMDGSIAWWNAETGKELARKRLSNFVPIQNATISIDGKFLACSTTLEQGNSKIWIWNLDTGEKVKERTLTKDLVQEISFANSKDLAVFATVSGVQDSSKGIWLWSAERDEWRPIGSKSMQTGSLWGAVPTLDGLGLLTYGGRGAKLWRLKDDAEVMSYRPSTAIRVIRYAPDGQLLAAGSQNGTIILWNPAESASQRKLVGGHVQAINGLAFSPDGSQLVSSAADGRVVVWDVKQGKILIKRRITERNVSGTGLAFGQNSGVILLAAEDQTVRILDATSLELRRKWSTSHGTITSIALSPDERWIATGGDDRTIRLWSAATGVEVASLLGHSAPIESVAFSSDGLRILSASRDTKVKLWDLDRLKLLDAANLREQPSHSDTDFAEMISLDFHTSEATMAEFSPDGKSVLTTGQDGYAAIWPSRRIPPALRMSTPSVTYTVNEGFRWIDTQSVMSVPSPMDLTDGLLSIVVQSADRPHLTLQIDPTREMFLVSDSVVRYKSSSAGSQEARWIEVAKVEAMEIGKMAIRFHSTMTPVIAEQMLRRIAFQWSDTATDEEMTQAVVELSLQDRYGASGNSQNEQILVRLIDEESQ